MYRSHVLVCGGTGCTSSGSAKVCEALETEIKAQGLEKEVQDLLKMGYTKDSPGLKAIGYSEWFNYEDKETIRYEIKHHSCKYAKKQYTYIKDIPFSHVIEYRGMEDIQKVIDVIK